MFQDCRAQRELQVASDYCGSQTTVLSPTVEFYHVLSAQTGWMQTLPVMPSTQLSPGTATPAVTVIGKTNEI